MRADRDVPEQLLARAAEDAHAGSCAVAREEQIMRLVDAEARRRGVELIVMGGEPPTQMRGGAVLGGRGGSRPPEIGEVTEYVLRKAPCRVLLTAPPEAPSPAADRDGGDGNPSAAGE